MKNQLQELIILMIDSETTSLNPDRGKAHQLGLHAVVTNGSQTRTLLSMNYYLPTTMEDWDVATYEWAKATIPDALSTTLTPPSTKWDGRMPTIKMLISDLEMLAKLSGPKAVVARHPEFDLPFFEKEGVDLRRVFGHRNFFDLTSLLVGAIKNRPTIDGINSHYRGDHTALGDCKAQMRQLEAADYAGLLTYYGIRRPAPLPATKQEASPDASH